MSQHAASSMSSGAREARRRGRSGRWAPVVAGLSALVLMAGPGFIGPSAASDPATLTFFAGTGTAGAPTPGPALGSDLESPYGIAFDSGGNTYIADADNHVVLKVTPGGTLSVFAGTGTAGAPTPGPATSSDVNYPGAVAVDSADNVYIAATEGHQVLKVTPGGTLSVFAGTGTNGAPTPGPALTSNLSTPFALAIDTSDNLYIADSDNNVIEKVTPGGTLSIVAGTGAAGAPTPGPATSSKLSYPLGVAVDAAGNVYIADAGNNRVEKVTPGGTLSIFAGTGAVGAPIPGPATSSPVAFPTSITVDAAGNVYVTDYESFLVNLVTPDGTLSVFAGTGTQGTPTPGPATSSDLGLPDVVAVDPSGNLYIGDGWSHRVLKVGSAATVPDAPTAVTGTAGDGSVTVAWTAPGSNGGSPITGYVVTAAPGGATCTTTGATSCVVTGLENGTGYTFTVTATNAAGTSSPSAPSATVTPVAGADIIVRFTG